jgi:hypothetical protein
MREPFELFKPLILQTNISESLTGYCAFTENTTMWCPEREEHGFYLTPLYKCDTGPRSNVIHRWVKVDIKARMPKPTGEGIIKLLSVTPE